MNLSDAAPQPPVREPMTLDEVATAAAVLVAKARDARLTAPCAMHCHSYGPPTVSLFVSEDDAGGHIWRALQEWADRFGGEVATHPATTPGSAHAYTEFRREGIRYEVYSVIHSAPEAAEDDDSDDSYHSEPGPQDAA